MHDVPLSLDKPPITREAMAPWVASVSEPASCVADIHISVQIVAYNETDALLALLAALAAQQGEVPHEVVLVDNGLDQATKQALAAYAITHIVARENLGCSLGRNVGAAFCRGSLVAFLDADGAIEAGYLDACVRAFSNNDVVAVRGRVAPKATGVGASGARASSAVLPAHYDLGVTRRYCPISAEGTSVWNLAAFLQAGGFEAGLAGGEGPVLCYRMSELFGHKPEAFAYEPSIVLYHDYATSPAHLRAKMKRYANLRNAIERRYPLLAAYTRRFDEVNASHGYASLPRSRASREVKIASMKARASVELETQRGYQALVSRRAAGEPIDAASTSVAIVVRRGRNDEKALQRTMASLQYQSRRWDYLAVTGTELGAALVGIAADVAVVLDEGDLVAPTLVEQVANVFALVSGAGAVIIPTRIATTATAFRAPSDFGDIAQLEMLAGKHAIAMRLAACAPSPDASPDPKPWTVAVMPAGLVTRGWTARVSLNYPTNSTRIRYAAFAMADAVGQGLGWVQTRAQKRLRKTSRVTHNLLRSRRKPAKRPRLRAAPPIIFDLAEVSDTQLRDIERLWWHARGRVFIFSPKPLRTTLHTIVTSRTLSLREMMAVCEALTNLGQYKFVWLFTKADKPQPQAARRVLVATITKAASPIVVIPELVVKATPRVEGALTLGVANLAIRADAAAMITAPVKRSGAALVSVVMTTFNEAGWVRQAIRSIQDQSYENLEIIVVDDASSDDTVAVLRDIAAQDPRVIVVALPENRGLFFSRNTGMLRATGTFLTFQDADDVSRLDRVEICLDAIGDADYVYGNYLRVTPEGAIAHSGQGAHREGIITMFLRREKVLSTAGYFDAVAVAADSEYFERLFMLRLRCVLLPDVLYYARLREGSLTTAGQLQIFSLAGQWTRNPNLEAYVASYRAFHASQASLFLAANGLVRNYVSPLACMTGEQLAWLRASFPGLAKLTHAAVAKHAVAWLVRNDSLPERISLQALVAKASRQRDVLVVSSTNRLAFIDNAIANFARQTHQGKRLVIVDNCETSQLDHIKARLLELGVKGEVMRVDSSHPIGYCLNRAIERFARPDSVICKFDDDDIYAPEYLHEQVAMLEARGGLVGKFPVFYYAVAKRTLYIRPKAQQPIGPAVYCSGPTMTFFRELWERFPFNETVTVGEDADMVARVTAAGIAISATSLFNFCGTRRTAAEHTWRIDEDKMFSPDMAEVVATGVELEELVKLVAFVPSPGA